MFTASWQVQGKGGDAPRCHLCPVAAAGARQDGGEGPGGITGAHVRQARARQHKMAPAGRSSQWRGRWGVRWDGAAQGVLGWPLDFRVTGGRRGSLHRKFTQEDVYKVRPRPFRPHYHGNTGRGLPAAGGGRAWGSPHRPGGLCQALVRSPLPHCPGRPEHRGLRLPLPRGSRPPRQRSTRCRLGGCPAPCRGGGSRTGASQGRRHAPDASG